MLIPLKGGLYATIDIADYYRVMGYNWCAILGKQESSTYAGAYVGRKLIYMHRLIRQPPDDMEIDHEDRNGLNNRWSNLRLATTSQNAFNKNYPRGRSQYVGVYFSDGRWRAKVSANYEQHYLGDFDTEEEAARARDDAAKLIQGRFARLNFPE